MKRSLAWIWLLLILVGALAILYAVRWLLLDMLIGSLTMGVLYLLFRVTKRAVNILRESKRSPDQELL